MAQLWGGRFTKETDRLVYNFNASISFDQKFFAQDIEGSTGYLDEGGERYHLEGPHRDPQGRGRGQTADHGRI